MKYELRRWFHMKWSVKLLLNWPKFFCLTFIEKTSYIIKLLTSYKGRFIKGDIFTAVISLSSIINIITSIRIPHSFSWKFTIQYLEFKRRMDLIKNLQDLFSAIVLCIPDIKYSIELFYSYLDLMDKTVNGT